MNARVRKLLMWPAFFAVPALFSFVVERQGFNLLDDGLWVLGTHIIARGGLLYRDIFTVYGPAQYYILLPFFWVLGESVRSLVVFKATVAGCSSILGVHLVRRHGAGRLGWLVPLCVLALGPVPPRYLFAAAFAALHATAYRPAGSRFTRGVLLGLAWGGLTLFGLDMFICGAIIVLAGHALIGLLAKGSFTLRDRQLAGTMAGLAGSLAAMLLLASATGSLGVATWDTIVCPLAFSPQHLTLNFLESFFRPQGMDTAFSQVFTGERLGPAWPGHVALRAVSVLLMAGLVLAAPLLALPARRLPVDARLGSLFALALCGWVAVLWRNDVAHVLAAFYGTLIVVTCLLGAIRPRRVPVAMLGAAALVAVMAPLAGERAWLFAHASRPSLVPWERPTAGISMAKDRRETIERVLGILDAGNGGPTLGWPAQPGLVFLSGRPPASRQVTLLAGSVRDEASVVADLQGSDPEHLVLGRVAGLTPGARAINELAPAIWACLRSNYFVELQLADGAEGFQVIKKAGPNVADLEGLPLERRLPGTSQLVKNSQTPPLEPGTVISQVFRVDGIDLRGIVILVATTGTLPAEMDIEVRVEELLAGGSTRSLAVFRSRVPLDQRAQTRTLAFPPVPRTAGKTVVLSLSARPEPGHEVRLLWHDSRADGGGQPDYYADGHALVNGRPVDADLFFISY